MRKKQGDVFTDVLRLANSRIGKFNYQGVKVVTFFCNCVMPSGISGHNFALRIF